MIHFKKIELEDFSCYAQAELEYAHSGLILVLGENSDNPVAESNAAGKSTIAAEALLFALFEQGTKERSPDGAAYAAHTLDDFIRHGCDSCRVALHLTLDKEQYLIERTRRRGGGDLTLTNLTKNTVLKGKNKAETQALLEQLLGINYSTFTQTVLFGQNSRRFTQARDAERKAVLQQMLHMAVYEQACIEVRGLLTRLAQSEQERHVQVLLLGQKIQIIDQGLIAARQNYNQQKKLCETFDKQLKAELKIIHQEIKQQQQIEQRERQAEQLLHQRALACEEDLRQLEISTLLQNENKCESLVVDCESTRRFCETEIKRVSERMLQMKSLQGAVCPTCQQNVSHSQANKLSQQLGGELTKLQHQRGSNVRRLQREQKALQQCRAQIQKHRDLNIKYDKLLDQAATCALAVENTCEAIEQAQQRRKQARQRSAPPPADREPVRLLADELQTLRRKYAHLEDAQAVDKQVRDDLTFWEHGFGKQGIPSLLLDGVLPVLNQRVNAYAAELLGDVQLQFDTESTLASGEKRDRFDVRVQHKTGQGYHLASGGERSRIDFCVALALQSLQASRFNIAIFDESFESIDEAGVEQMVNVLRAYAWENAVAVYCVTHLHSLKPLFDRVVTVRKSNGVASIVR